MESNNKYNRSNCGKEIENPTSNICPYCGKDIYKKQINLIKCPNCGQEYNDNEMFCPFCGEQNLKRI